MFDSNQLRASVGLGPLGGLENSDDTVKVHVSAGRDRSENKATFAVLNPSDSIADWLVRMAKTLCAGWCRPGIPETGVYDSADKAMALSPKWH